MLEGTRNERAAIVGTAYLIGFVTAFIAFGLNQIDIYDTEISADSIMHAAQPAAVFTAHVALNEHETGLVLSTGTDSILLSASQNIADTAVLDDGLHESLAHYELSPDKLFAYFCEVPVAGLDSCKPFVYSLADDMSYPLTQGNARIALPADQQTIVWGPAGVVTIGDTPVDPLPR